MAGPIKTLRALLRRLPTRRRHRFWLLLMGMFLAAGLEALSAGIIALYASCVTDPDLILQTHLPRLQRFIPFDLPETFQGMLILLSILVVTALVLKNITQAIVSYASKLYSANISGYIGRLLLEGFLRLPYEWHVTQNPADLILSIEWRRYVNMLITSSLKTMSDSLIVIIMLTTLLVVEPWISVLLIATVGGTAMLIFSQVRQAIDTTARQHLDLSLSINQEANTALQGVKDVKIYGREAAFIKRYTTWIHPHARVDVRLQILQQCPIWILETVGFTMLCSAICLMFLVTANSTARVTGVISLLAVTAWRVLPAMVRILEGLTTIRQALPYVHTELTYLDEADTAAPMQQMVSDRLSFSRQIEVKDVSFSYRDSNREVLHDISLTIPRGQAIGIIGTSGAGKSTLVDLLIGLLTPTRGEILVDDVRLESSRHVAWNRTLGYVSQSPYIFDGPLAQNVAFGVDPDKIDHAQVSKSCHLAAMDDFLHQLPEGGDTVIGERGIRLSGGQRQRVAIARALYHQPRIIIFDEATSALDPRNEQAIQQTIYSLKDRMTLIIIAHRLTTVKECDKIIWIKDGTIRMAGDTPTVLDLYKKHQHPSPVRK